MARGISRDGFTAAQLNNLCIAEIDRLGGFAWRNNTGALKAAHGSFVKFGLKGSGDVIGFMPPSGVFFSLETKTKNDRLSVDQQEFILRAKTAGAYAAVVESEEDAKRCAAEIAELAYAKRG